MNVTITCMCVICTLVLHVHIRVTRVCADACACTCEGQKITLGVFCVGPQYPTLTLARQRFHSEPSSQLLGCNVVVGTNTQPTTSRYQPPLSLATNSSSHSQLIKILSVRKQLPSPVKCHCLHKTLPPSFPFLA